MRSVLVALALWVSTAGAIDCPKIIVDGDRFERNYRAHLVSPIPVPSEARERARELNYLFVDGYLNEEWFGRYFYDNMRELRQLGIPSSRIHSFPTNSSLPFEENLTRFEEQVRQLRARDPGRPLVFTGHSRGSALLVAFALRNRAFIEENGQPMFLVQGALGGCGIADYLSIGGRLARGGESLPLAAIRTFFQWFRPGYLVAAGELSQDPSRAYWENLHARHQGDIEALSPYVNYIVSSVPVARASYFLQFTTAYLQRAFGDNDGIILTEDQSLSWLGRVVLREIADHSDFVLPWPLSGTGHRMRRALTRAMVLEVAGGRAPRLP